MATVNRNSDVIANAVATPVVRNNSHTNGVVKSAIGICTPAADDTSGSVHRYVRVPSNVRLADLKISAADASTAGKYDFGLYYPVDHANAGAVIDADCISNAFDLAGGPFYRASVLNVTDITIANSAKMLWQVAGLSADPGCDFDIAGTIDTTFNGAPTSVSVEAIYVE